MRTSGIPLILILLFSLALTSMGVGSCQPQSDQGAAPSASASVEIKAEDLSPLSRAITERREKVLEFRVIREEARRLGIRVWLFGGTAAGYAHYVNWDLKREAGDARYLESRFDYDFTNIYRSTQDADLVVDGKADDVKKLEALIRERLSHLQGSKDDWELRLLREDYGWKLALLNNPNFLNQHTDSNSTGMIELTDPPPGESVIRDLRDWADQETPQFLVDVFEGKLRYYFSPRHQETELYKQGLNPPIFSVIRYFTKAFQYELEMRPEDLAAISKVIQQFDPQNDLKVNRARGRFERLGTRLILHASNIEFAWDTLERIGLRRKLIACSNPKEVGSMGWWLNKEPLRTKPLGYRGWTLRDVLKKEGFSDPESVTFAHDTSDFLAWESITRDTTGRPNVVISREGFPGEAARYGDGHYTRLGHVGAKGTGFTIRYKADLDSKLGEDFTFQGDFFVWKNRSSLRVISESLNLSPSEYFERVLKGSRFGEGDRGIEEKVRKRIRNRPLPWAEEKKIYQLLYFRLPSTGDLSADFLQAFKEWAEFPASAEYPDLVQKLIDRDEVRIDAFVLRNVLVHPAWAAHPGFARAILDRGKLDVEFVESVLSSDAWAERGEWVATLLSPKRWSRSDRAKVEQALATFVLPKLSGAEKTELGDRLVEAGASDLSIAKSVLADPNCGADCARWARVILRRVDPAALRQMEFWFQPYWVNHPEVFVEALRMDKPQFKVAVFEALKHPMWKSRPEVLQELIVQWKLDSDLIDRLLSQREHWREHPMLRWACGGRQPTATELLKGIQSGRVDFFKPPKLGKASCDDLLKIENPTLQDYYDVYGW